MAKISPLHRVIGAARWEGERLLGRLVILAHSAFLDAGFVPAGDHDDENSIRLPSKVGRTASSLPLRYAVPQLLHRPDAAAVQLRLLVHGRNLVFYVSITRTSMFRDPWLDTYWICLDALAAAVLLSGGLDDTARALRRDARLAALWSALTDRLCRRVLVDLCARNGVTLEPTFMSLPGDVKAAILARLAGDEDLARVECTCTGLRYLVAERDATLWKPRYEKLLVAGVGCDETTPEMGWKEMYMAASSRRPIRFGVASRRGIVASWPAPWMLTCLWNDHQLPNDSFEPFRLFDSPELLEETVPRRRRRWRAMPRDACGHGSALVLGGYKKKQHGAGEVHSPSSRFRWKHR